MESIHGSGPQHAKVSSTRRRRARGSAATTSAGYVSAPLPPGSRRLGPVQAGEQGISAQERPHAERAIARLFEAKGVDMVALYDRESNTYELRSRTGSIHWERWATPDGELRYRVVKQTGENPIPNVDGTILRTIEEEAEAAGGIGKHVPKDRNSYPDMFGRLAQLFDHARAPEFVYIPTPGGDLNHPGAGSHGIPDMVQSRAPLVIAAPGVAKGAVADGLVRHEDIAPTVADLLGVQPVMGTNASGVRRPQLLKWQDGVSLTSRLADAKLGARNLRGAAERAVVFTIDGMSQTALLDEIQKGNLPNLARIMASGTMFRNGSLAQYPTVTWANHNTVVTGASPGHSGIVNNSWYEREEQREQLITDGSFTNSLRTARFISPNVETLYEAVERSFEGARTMAINQPSGRGADVSVLDLKGLPSILANIAKIGWHLIANRSLVDKELEGASKGWKTQTLHDGFATALGQTFWSKKDPPKLGVFEYTLVDNRGHAKGPHHPDARRALQQVDRQVGKVLDTLDERGLTDSTAIVLTADHGMGHQDTDESKLGGWFEALDQAAADGARTVESTRFVYVRSVQWRVEGPVPRVGQQGTLALSVRNDDTDRDGQRPAVAGATVVVRDGSGREWRGVTDVEGRIQLPIHPRSGPLQVRIEHVDFSVEEGTIPLASL